MLDFHVFASMKVEDQDHSACKDKVFYMTHVLNGALYQPWKLDFTCSQSVYRTTTACIAILQTACNKHGT